MVSSSSNQQDVPESTSSMQQQQQGASEPGFVIKPKTMTIPMESLKV
jgi:hypothetical protein